MSKNLVDAEKATTFTSREACQEWIDKRVMRFKASFVMMPIGPGQFRSEIQKHTGTIVDTTQPGYKKLAFDEPLKRMAKPVREGELWRAVIPTQHD